MLWPIDELNALRLGRRLVTEIPAAGPGRRAFATIRPLTTAADETAQTEGWTRPTFHLTHWNHNATLIEGFDIGAVLVRSATATGEAALTRAVDAWGLHPDQFLHPWQTADPR